MRATRTLSCWAAAPPAAQQPTGTFLAVSVASTYACAVRANFSLACWGTTALPAAPAAPNGVDQRFFQLSTAGDVLCALANTGVTYCWTGGSPAVVWMSGARFRDVRVLIDNAYPSSCFTPQPGVHVCGVPDDDSGSDVATTYVCDDATFSFPAGIRTASRIDLAQLCPLGAVVAAVRADGAFVTNFGSAGSGTTTRNAVTITVDPTAGSDVACLHAASVGAPAVCRSLSAALAASQASYTTLALLPGTHVAPAAGWRVDFAHTAIVGPGDLSNGSLAVLDCSAVAPPTPCISLSAGPQTLARLTLFGGHTVALLALYGRIDMVNVTVTGFSLNTNASLILKADGGPLTLVDCGVVGNRIVGGATAPLLSVTDVPLSLGRCDFRDNVGWSALVAVGTGGSVGPASASAPGSLAVANCSFSNSSGPALSMSSGAALNVSACTFADLTSNGSGGAVRVVAASHVSIGGSAFLRCTAVAGGGAVWIEGAPDISLAQCAFRANTAFGDSGGGAVAVSAAPAVSGTSTGTSIAMTGIECQDNWAAAGAGGAIALRVDVARTILALVVDLVCTSNRAHATGGCCDVRSASASTGGSSSVAFARLHATDNVAQLGGGATSFAGALLSVAFDASQLINNTAGAGDASGDGGAIALSSVAALAVTGSLLADNVAGGSGGALATTGGESTPVISLTDSSLLDNACGQFGGAVSASRSSLLATRCTLARNRTPYAGGAIALRSASSASFLDSSITDNRAVGDAIAMATASGFSGLAAVGGGVVCLDSSLALLRTNVTRNLAGGVLGGGGIYGVLCTATAEDARFDANGAPGGDGGAVALGLWSSLAATRLCAAGNSATGAGGVLQCAGCASVQWTGGECVDNSARVGGCVAATGVGALSLPGVALARNSAAASGGALYLVAPASGLVVLLLSGAQMTSNSARISGGAIFSDRALAEAAPNSTAARALDPLGTNSAPYGPFAATPPAALQVLAGAPFAARSGGDVTPTPTLALLDAYGQLATSDNSTVVSVACSQCPTGSGNLLGALIRSAMQGAAVFDALRAALARGTYTLAFSAAGVAGGTTVDLDVGACAAGSAPADGTGVVCLPCVPGSFGNSSGICSACDSGRYQALPGSTTCVACQPGSAADAGASACHACSAGSYSNGSAQGSTCESCAAGRFQPQSGATACLDCAADGVAPDTGATVCAACGTGAAPMNGSHVACASCVPGNYQPSRAAANCIACERGSFAASDGATTCASCAPGSFTNATRASTCASCPVGRFAGASGALACSSCPDGTSAIDVGATSCALCAAGTASVTNGSMCESCASGRFQRARGASTCDDCTPGTYAASLSFTSCIDCEIGSASNATRASACTKCPLGRFAGVPGTVQCSACPDGTSTADIDASGGATSCALCAAGTVRDQWVSV